MAFEFDRYINGQLMAEGVTIERQKNLADAMREAARIASRGPNGEVPVLVLRALAERAGGVNEDALRALAQAYDREDSAQRGEPDPWNLDDPGDIGDSDTWVSERLACARVAAEAFLSALEPAAPEGRQEAVAWQHIPNCGVDRESKMVHVTGKVFCDPCIAPLVAALNAAGVETIASCCGHTHRPGCIALRDGRELIIAQDYDEARKIEAMFPVDINGNTALSTITPAEVGGLVAELRNPDFRGSMQHLRSAGEIDRLFQQAAAILEAHAAELLEMKKSQMRQASACGVATARAERAEAQRDEALKALAEAEHGLIFAGADKEIADGDFVPAPTAALRIVRAARRALGGKNG